MNKKDGKSTSKTINYQQVYVTKTYLLDKLLLKLKLRSIVNCQNSINYDSTSYSDKYPKYTHNSEYIQCLYPIFYPQNSEFITIQEIKELCYY